MSAALNEVGIKGEAVALRELIALKKEMVVRKRLELSRVSAQLTKLSHKLSHVANKRLIIEDGQAALTALFDSPHRAASRIASLDADAALEDDVDQSRKKDARNRGKSSKKASAALDDQDASTSLHLLAVRESKLRQRVWTKTVLLDELNALNTAGISHQDSPSLIDERRVKAAQLPSKFKVNDRVVHDSKGRAVVKFVGQMLGRDGTWIGLLLDRLAIGGEGAASEAEFVNVGLHDGSLIEDHPILGTRRRRYFTAPWGRAIFSRAAQLTLQVKRHEQHKRPSQILTVRGGWRGQKHLRVLLYPSLTFEVLREGVCLTLLLTIARTLSLSLLLAALSRSLYSYLAHALARLLSCCLAFFLYFRVFLLSISPPPRFLPLVSHTLAFTNTPLLLPSSSLPGDV